jgi:hypothetical protein
MGLAAMLSSGLAAEGVNEQRARYGEEDKQGAHRAHSAAD